MSAPLSSLDLIPSFHAVMKTGSLSAAARTQRLSQPTVRRHIESLEAELGAQLFTRAANGLTPTEMAHNLLPMAAAVIEEARALARAASGAKDQLGGTVRLTCSRIVATHVLPPLLADLQHSAPMLQFEVAATDAEENLARRAADIAIRFAEPRQLSLVTARLPDVALGVFAAAHSQAPVTLEDAPFIADDTEDRLLPALQSAGLPVPRHIALRCDDPLAQISAIQAGLGVGVMQCKLAARLGLTRVFPDLTYAMPAWLVVHEDQGSITRVRHVFDHLKASLPRMM